MKCGQPCQSRHCLGEVSEAARQGNAASLIKTHTWTSSMGGAPEEEAHLRWRPRHTERGNRALTLPFVAFQVPVLGAIRLKRLQMLLALVQQYCWLTLKLSLTLLDNHASSLPPPLPALSTRISQLGTPPVLVPARHCMIPHTQCHQLPPCQLAGLEA